MEGSGVVAEHQRAGWRLVEWREQGRSGGRKKSLARVNGGGCAQHKRCRNRAPRRLLAAVLPGKQQGGSQPLHDSVLHRAEL